MRSNIQRWILELAMTSVWGAGCGIPSYRGADAGSRATGGTQTDASLSNVGESIEAGSVGSACTSDDDCVAAGGAGRCGSDNRCVQCVPGAATGNCGAGLYCTEKGTCAIGCADSTDCGPSMSPGDVDAAPSAAALSCDVATHTCLGCAQESDCPPGTTCDMTARCVPGCPSLRCPGGFVCCLGQCIETTSGARGCSACGSLCSNKHGVTSCIDDTCSPVCDPGYDNCDGNPNNGCESALDTLAHCGRCDQACSNDHGTTACTTGGCAPSCAGSYGDCDGNPNNGCETNLDSSVAHCSACGQSCATEKAVAACVRGSCAIEACNPGFRDCDGEIANGCEVDVANDASHCGACDTACTNEHGATICQAGACVPLCSEGWGDCDGIANNGCETHTDTDALNCNTCGNVCLSALGTPNCVGGKCGYTQCGFGLGDCNATGNCNTSLTTTSNCGTCGHACSAVNGTPTCAAHGDAGAGADVDAGADAGARADAGAGAIACAIQCGAGFADCKNGAMDGCETATTTLTDCGGCGIACARPNMQMSCAASTCQPAVPKTCTGGFNDCNDSPTDGCESDPAADIDNCGGCGTRCANPHGSTTCAAGVCTPACESGWGVCGGNPKDGCLANLTLPESCGATCAVCGGSTPNCVAGTCTPSYQTITLANSAVYALAGGSASTTMQLKTNKSANASRLLLFAVVTGASDEVHATPSDVIFNNAAHPPLKISSWNGKGTAWAAFYYLGEPGLPDNSGSYPLVVASSANGVLVNVVELTGVDQSSPFDNDGIKSTGGGSPSGDTVAIVTPGAWAFDVLASTWPSGGALGKAGAAQTVTLDQQTNGELGAASYQKNLSVGSAAFSWTTTGSQTAHVLLAVRPARM